jgi:septation ring formation regulator EzrA
MLTPREKFEQEVTEYRKQLKEINQKIEEKRAEHSRESVKLPKLRTRKLSEINDEIQKLHTTLSTPRKNCPNCNTNLSYDAILCWHCGETFLDVCPKCGIV